MAQKYVEQNIHPLKIVQGFARALEDAVGFVGKVAVPIDLDNKVDMQRCVASCLGTKVMGRLDELMVSIWCGHNLEFLRKSVYFFSTTSAIVIISPSSDFKLLVLVIFAGVRSLKKIMWT